MNPILKTLTDVQMQIHESRELVNEQHYHFHHGNSWVTARFDFPFHPETHVIFQMLRADSVKTCVSMDLYTSIQTLDRLQKGWIIVTAELRRFLLTPSFHLLCLKRKHLVILSGIQMLHHKDNLKVEIMSFLLLGMCGRVLLGAVFGDDTSAHRVRVTSGFVSIWSEQSDGAGEASHTSLCAQREWRSEEGGRERRRSGWEVCRWLITTHICSPHFLFPLIAFISSLSLAPFYRFLFDLASNGKHFMALSQLKEARKKLK